MSTTWTTERVARHLSGYGVKPEIENTGGNVMAVTVEHNGFTLAITDNGSGVYTTDGWNDGEDPLAFNEETRLVPQVFAGMADFARLSGWQKGA